MVNKCVAFGCKSGYKGHDKLNSNGSKITFHAFPLANKELCDRWIRANPRSDFNPSKYSKLCSLHFRSSDFVDVRTADTNAARQRRKSVALGEKLSHRYLKDDAVPTIFPNSPKYLSSHSVGPRETVCATSSSRQERETHRLDILQKSFHAADDISSLSLIEVLERLKTETAMPVGFTFTIVDTALLIYWLQVRDNIPSIKACISVQHNFAVAVSLDGKSVPASQYSDIFKGHVQCISELVNLMARVKSWSDTDAIESKSLKMSVQMAVSCLSDGLDNLDDSSSDEFRKISFVIEQLKLLSKNKFGRHYSPELTIMSYRLHAASSAAYSVLLKENVLCLPSKSTLQKVTKRFDSTSGLDNSQYLKLRVSKLNEFERTVILMIDEIYVAKRVEYSGGEVQGLTADGSVASTLLCFMVKSLTSKYKDLVAIYPMCKLTAAQLYDCYQEVTVLLRSASLNVVAISVDNATANRKFFIDFLCGGTLRTHVIDPITSQPIFLIFDPVHDIKNVYNNFLARKTFTCPTMERNLPNGCNAKFQDIVELYNLEATMALKKAHRLTPATLDPKSVEKTSVKLAVSVFCESTRDALKFYAAHEGKAAWSGTADFITLIIKLWNVMNVKSCTKGKHKRNYTMDPIRSSQDWKLYFLSEFAEFLQRWERSRQPGLTRETFLALRQTCLALRECATYLLLQRGFNYVLLGNLQSDAIESRFGWLRQLSGANYYISTRQVLESNRKIRAVSLVKFSGFTLTEIDDAIQSYCQSSSSSSGQSCDGTTADAMVESLTYQTWPSASDANIICYVSGAIARSIVRSTKCDDCREVLINPSDHLEPLELDEALNYKASTFLDSINRGGLSRPSDFTFMSTVHCWRVYDEIKSTADLKDKLLSATNQRSLFVKVIERATENGQLLVDDNFCTKGHDLKELITQRFFNCVAKNLAKELTATANPPSEQSAKKRKIAKLTSKTTANS